MTNFSARGIIKEMENTLNASRMKKRNRAEILRLIRQTGCSRAELAKRTGLTRAAVSLIVDECLRLGMLEEGDKNPSAVGRRSVGLRTRGGYGHRIGLNISREAYTLGLVDFGGKIIRSFRKEISADLAPTEVLGEICEIIRAMKEGAEGVFLGIGVTMPGPLSRESGALLKVPNLSAWNDFPVRKYFEDAFSCPVCLDNNSNAAAQAEPFYNPDVRGVSFMELIVDSGLGSGVMLYAGGRVVGFDCEFGHTSLRSDGEKCSCGNFGCAELYASMKALLRYAQSLGCPYRSWEGIADGYLADDALCKEAGGRETLYLGRLLVNAVNSFALDAVVFAGEIVYRFEEIFAARLQKIVEEGSIKKKIIKIVTSKIGNVEILASANLVGESDGQED